MTELKKCPFCGSGAKVSWFAFGELCVVECENRDCGAEGPCKKTEAEAVQAWDSGARNADLLAAAQAVVDRWESPAWKDAEPTAAVIGRLRREIEKAVVHAQAQK